MPPTRTASSISEALRPASINACSHGLWLLSTRSSVSCSSFALESLITKCFGPDASAVINGRFISDSITEESSIFAFSAASFSRWRAILSLERSMPWSFLNSTMSQSITLWSKLSPPRCVSPFVALTSKTPSPTSRMDMSNVPPPKS